MCKLDVAMPIDHAHGSTMQAFHPAATPHFYRIDERFHVRATSDAASLMLTAIASLLAGLGVAAGAVAAHAGSAFADPQAESWLQTASQYQIWHALAIMLLGMIRPVKLLWPAALMLLGVVLFCGSLYARSFGLIESTPLAPWGGLALMAAWLWTALQCFLAVFSSQAKADC